MLTVRKRGKNSNEESSSSHMTHAICMPVSEGIIFPAMELYAKTVMQNEIILLASCELMYP